MSLQQFISAFGGHEATTLCQYLAVANGNQALINITLTQSEAKRYIAGWQGDITKYSTPQWTQLAEEIYHLLDNCNKDPHKIKRQVCRILMQLKKVAPYKTSLFEYQKACGIALTSEITPESLAQSMDWTTDMAKDYMNISSEEDKKIAPLSTIPELKQAMEDGIIDSDGNVQCSDRQLVMYFYEHRMFLPLNKKDFRRIDRLLTSQRKTTIHCGDLSKVAQQLRKEGLIEDHIRYQGKHINKYS